MTCDIDSIGASSNHAWLRLTLVPALAPHKQRDLLCRFGSADAALAAHRDDVAAVVGEALALALSRGPDRRAFEATQRWLAQPGCRMVGLGDADYPGLWKQIASPPAAFFVQGDTRLLNRPTLAVVGSRNATPIGARDAFEFSRALSDHGLTVASGLALGIDASAHRGALAGASSTIAVMGTGPDRIYPRGNAALAREIVARGCLVSEFPAGTPPLDWNFPRRNRLISGLARGVLIVEAAYPSGSISTARSAVEQNRDVFALPGSIHSPLSKGCHWLIKQGAKLVDCVDDILQELALAPPPERPPSPERDTDPLLAAVGFDGATIDEIAERAELDAATLAARLSCLEIEGRVRSLPGGRFQRVENRVIE